MAASNSYELIVPDMNPPLLERLTITLVAVLLAAALVAWIKYDIERTAASQPASTRGAQLRPVSGCAPAMTPTFAVPDLLGRVARFQLAERVVDRGEGYREAVVL